MTNLFKMPLILKAKIKVFTSLDIIYLIFINGFMNIPQFCCFDFKLLKNFSLGFLLKACTNEVEFKESSLTSMSILFAI